MKYVYEVLACEEYAWQDSHGLYESLEAARSHFPEYTESIEEDEDGMIIVLLEHKDEVMKAIKESKNSWYWWYSLPHHGSRRTRADDAPYDRDTDMTFYGVFRREVKSVK